jgi:integrase
MPVYKDNTKLKERRIQNMKETIETEFLNKAKVSRAMPSTSARICGSMDKKNADSMDYYSLEEFKTFIAVFEEKPKVNLMLEILFWTGIRSGELLALKLADFNFVTKVISINKVANLSGKDLILEARSLNSKRVIAIPEFLMEMIMVYVAKLSDIQPND